MKRFLVLVPLAMVLVAGCSNSPGGNAAGDVPTASPSKSWDCSQTSELSMAEWTEHCADDAEMSEPEGDVSPTSAAPATQPIDGGTYTWPSGITLKLAVEDYGKWGRTSDFCGDGSCGVAVPEASDIGIRYTVTVPADFSGTFDPYSCPGNVSVVNGNDEEAGGGVVGDHDQSISGPMLPGATKEGVAERWIAPDYAGQQFLLTSSCGDAEYSGQPALFTGSLG